MADGKACAVSLEHHLNRVGAVFVSTSISGSSARSLKPRDVDQSVII
jgi:hypothetical protein